MRKIFIAFLTVSCISCGTIGARAVDPSYGEFYPATKKDFKGIDDAYSESNWFFSPWFIVPLLIVDMPISFATDTLFLPADIAVIIFSPKEESKDADKRY